MRESKKGGNTPYRTTVTLRGHSGNTDQANSEDSEVIERLEKRVAELERENSALKEAISQKAFDRRSLHELDEQSGDSLGSAGFFEERELIHDLIEVAGDGGLTLQQIGDALIKKGYRKVHDSSTGTR